MQDSQAAEKVQEVLQQMWNALFDEWLGVERNCYGMDGTGELFGL